MDHLIVDVHRAGLEPEGWPNVVAKIAGFVGASWGSLHLVDRATGRLDVLGAHGFEPEAFGECSGKLHRVDVFGEALLRSPPGRSFVLSQLIDQGAFEPSELCRGLPHPQDLSHCMGGIVAEHGDVATLIGLVRCEDLEPFAAREVSVLDMLLPHLGQAVSVHHRLTRMQEHMGALEGVADQWPMGVIFAEADSTVVWCNRTAAGILREADGLQMQRRRLTADHREVNRELRSLVTRAANDAGENPCGGGTSVPRRSLAEAYTVLVAPLPRRINPPHCISRRRLAVVFLRDPGKVVRTPAGTLRHLYQLTPAEARLTEALIAGNCLYDAANLLTITESTARSYLKRILRKTGVRRQSELIRLVLSGVAPLAYGENESQIVGGEI